jgi:hypothetical protein
LVVNLPGLGDTPTALESPFAAALDTVSWAHDVALAAKLAAWQATLDDDDVLHSPPKLTPLVKSLEI